MYNFSLKQILKWRILHYIYLWSTKFNPRTFNCERISKINVWRTICSKKYHPKSHLIHLFFFFFCLFFSSTFCSPYRFWLVLKFLNTFIRLFSYIYACLFKLCEMHWVSGTQQFQLLPIFLYSTSLFLQNNLKKSVNSMEEKRSNILPKPLALVCEFLLWKDHPRIGIDG